MSHSRVYVTALVALLGCALVGAFAMSQQPPPPPTAESGPALGGTPTGAPAVGDADEQANPDMETQTRGPVHEAFAEPVQASPEAGAVVPKQPPAPIEEVPPDEKPEGSNIVWLPGYWAWDDERTDFLWVSGVYRAVPWDRTFVSGYWHQVQGGWQWVPGFWTNTKKEEVTYLPQPPATVEQGPTSAAPGENYFWVPGSWMWRTRYAWRPGYWTQIYPDWIWIPAHYVWTPAGYVFVDGYWDYPLAQRGVLFAPVYYRRPLYLGPRYFYSPSIVINTGLLTLNLFMRPTFGHYYFGDYYGNSYVNLGFRPWFATGGRSRFGYDPLFNYYRWQHVHRDRDPQWVAGLQRRFDTLQKNPADRPPRDFSQQQKNLAKFPGAAGRGDAVIGMPLKQVVAAGKNGRMPGNVMSENFKFAKIDATQQQSLRKRSFDAQQAVLKERKQMEDVTVGGKRDAVTGRFPGATGQAGSGKDGGATLTDSPRSFKLPSATIAGAGSTATPGTGSTGAGTFNRGRTRDGMGGTGAIGGTGTGKTGDATGQGGRFPRTLNNQGQLGGETGTTGTNPRTNRGTSSFPGFDSGNSGNSTTTPRTNRGGSSFPGLDSGGGTSGAGKSGATFPGQSGGGTGGGTGSGSGGRLRNQEKSDKDKPKGADFPKGADLQNPGGNTVGGQGYNPRSYIDRNGRVVGDTPDNSARRTATFNRGNVGTRDLSGGTDPLGPVTRDSFTPGYGPPSNPVIRAPQQFDIPGAGRRTASGDAGFSSSSSTKDPIVRVPKDAGVQFSGPRSASKPVVPSNSGSGGSGNRGRLRDRDDSRDKDKDKLNSR